jgi:DNA-binding cell septation regulator SpoVG
MHEKAKPAGDNGGHREISVSNWKAHEKRTLRGFLTLTLPSGLVIHNCMLHEKDGKRWIALPSRQYKNAEGSPTYTPLIEFATKDARQRFQEAALKAVELFSEGAP